jgi:hypothetical protein
MLLLAQMAETFGARPSQILTGTIVQWQFDLACFMALCRWRQQLAEATWPESSQVP